MVYNFSQKENVRRIIDSCVDSVQTWHWHAGIRGWEHKRTAILTRVNEHQDVLWSSHSVYPKKHVVGAGREGYFSDRTPTEALRRTRNSHNNRRDGLHAVWFPRGSPWCKWHVWALSTMLAADVCEHAACFDWSNHWTYNQNTTRHIQSC